MPSIQNTVDTTVSAGAFNRRVSIQTPVDTKDNMGGTVRTWVTAFSTWAYVEPWKGTEGLHAGQPWGSMYARFLLRYRPSLNINDTMRILYGARVYNIRSVNTLAEAKTTIEITAEELQATGSTH